jgi:hypothetical protein
VVELNWPFFLCTVAVNRENVEKITIGLSTVAAKRENLFRIGTFAYHSGRESGKCGEVLRTLSAI